MGNTQAQKLSIETKMQFLETKVIKPCAYHHKQAISYCSIPSCRKSPYLCQDCLTQKIHSHTEGIHNHDNFIKALVTLIQLKRDHENKLLESSLMKPSKDYSWILKEELKLMQHLQGLQLQINSQIGTFKKKLQASIDQNARRANRDSTSKVDSYYRFYSNPNILVNKLSSEPNDAFLMDLKQKVNIGVGSDKNLMISGEEEIIQFKNDLTNLKASIRELVNVSNYHYFKKGVAGGVLSAPNLQLKQKIPIGDNPRRIFQIGGEQFTICTLKEVIKVNAYSKQKNKAYPQPIIQISGVNSGPEFVGLVNPTSLLVYNGSTFEKVPSSSKISKVRVIKNKKVLYGVFGEEEGVLNIVDLEKNKSVFHYRCGDRPVVHLEVCEKASTIYAATVNSGLHIFKYQTRFDQYEFEFASQMSPTLYPSGELQHMMTHNHDLIMFGPRRNIVVFDVILNAEIIRTQYQAKSPAFTHSCIVYIDGTEFLITLCQNESEVYSWMIDRSKRTVKVDPLNMPGKEGALLGIASNSDQLWMIKDSEKEASVMTLSLQ